MQKYSNILSGLKEISNYCDKQQFREEPFRSFNICIGDISLFFQQYITSQSEKPKGSELKLPNLKGEISKTYVDQEINDVKTIIQKKILGLNVYENKVEKINEDIRKQFDRKAAQFTATTKQFQKILESRMNKIQMHLHQTLYDYDKKIQGNLTKQQIKLTKSVDDNLKIMENNFTDDVQKLYIKITELEKKNVNQSSPQKRQNYGMNQRQYQMNSSGVKFNLKRVGQSAQNNRISTADRRNQSRIPSKDNAYLYNIKEEQQLRRYMLSQPKKIPETKVISSHIGSFGKPQEIKQPLRKNIQARDWANENWGSQKYNFDRNLIIAQQPSFIFSKKQIKDGYTFCVSMIDRTFAVGLGIADSKYKRVSNIQDIKYKIIYFADGDYWEGSQKRPKSGSGFKQQQCISVSVNPLFKQIQWKVGGQVRFRSRSELFSHKISWVPFIFLGAKGATVGIAQQ